jgi:hypothetical protein
MRLPGRRAQDAAVEAIALRRASCGDDDLEALRDDPAGVISYVLMHRDVPQQVLAQDVADVLVLIRCHQAWLTRALHSALELAHSREVGMTWAKIAPLVGLESPQGAMQLYQRLDSERKGGPRSEVDWRQTRRQAAFAARRAAEITAAARAVVQGCHSGAPDLEALQEALDDPDSSAVTVMVFLRIAVKGLVAAGQIAEGHPAVGLVGDWERLGRKHRRTASIPGAPR